MKKQAKIAMTLTALVGVGAVSMTYAYWNQTATIDNPFNTQSYGTSVVEDFSPSDGEDWQPGSTVVKEVTVTNEGTADLIVRAKLDENWTYTGEDEAFKTVNGETDGDVYVVDQADETDGLVANDKSVVEKIINDDDTWIDGGDGWYYYYENLAGGETSEAWLEAVTLDADADMGEYNVTYWVSADKETWVEYTEEFEGAFVVPETYQGTAGEEFVVAYSKVVKELGDNVGYSDADYVLTVTIESVQATEDAVADMFGADATAPAGVTWTYVSGTVAE